MTNKVLKIITIVILTAVIIVLTATITAFVIQKNQTGPEIVYYTQILTRGTVKSIDDEGILVEIEDESSFGGLNVHINNTNLKEQYTVGDFLDIYYDGTIIDGTVARFHKIYKIERFRSENITLGDEWKPCDKTSKDEWFTKNIQPLLNKTFNSDGKHIVDNCQVLAQNSKQHEMYAILCHIQSKDNDSQWRIVYIKDQGGIFSVIYHTVAFLTTEQISFEQ